jgi:hypothetical protein
MRLDAYMIPSEDKMPQVGLKLVMPDFSAGEVME